MQLHRDPVQPPALLLLIETDTDFAAALAAGATLAERVGGPVAGPPSAGDLNRAARALPAWRAIPPFEDSQWWTQRLREAGLSADELLHLVAGAGAHAPWVDRVVEAYGQPPDDLPTGLQGIAVLAEPLIVAERRRLLDAVAALPGTADVVDVEGVVNQLTGQLSEQIAVLATRTVVLELNIARLTGALMGDTPEQRYRSFVSSLADREQQRRILATYPVLARQLATATRTWGDFSVRFLRDLVADHRAVQDQFAPGTDLGPLVAVSGGMGDRHRGGASVLAARFAGGLRLMYKPRPMAVERHFQQLVEWVNDHAPDHELRSVDCLDRGDHGWAEWVVGRPCPDPSLLGAFYWRHGAMLALLHVLAASDFHSENVIAEGEHPVPVDLESLAQPSLALTDELMTPAERTVGAIVAGSVLRVGLLPSRTWTDDSEVGVDLSGIGHRPGQLTPSALPYLHAEGTDEMAVRRRRSSMDNSAHRPLPSEIPINLLDHADAVVDGFRSIYSLLADHREELGLPDGPLGRFAGDEVRVLARHTAQYAFLQATSYHPDVLRDGLRREQHWDLLWGQVPRLRALAAFVPHERHDLWQDDVPVFTARTDGREVYGGDGTVLSAPAGLVERTGMENLANRLRDLGQDDLERQTWLIRVALTTTAVDAGPRLVYPSYDFSPTPTGPGRDVLVARAVAVADHLARIAQPAEDEVEWLGINSLRGQDWSLGALGPDLYHGLIGVGLFLAYAHRHSSDPRHRDLAEGAVRTALRHVERGMLTGMIGMAGIGGTVWACTSLGRLWEDDRLLDTAAEHAALLVPSIPDDKDFDIVLGSGGAILSLAALHHHRPDGRLLDGIRAAADHLLARRVPAGDGSGWLSGSMVDSGLADRPLAGFAHGAAGIAWALLVAADLLGDEKLVAAARDAVAYEQQLYDRGTGNWTDVRTFPPVEGGGSPVGGGDAGLLAWCHGAPGVGIGRILCLPQLGPELRPDIEAALDVTRRAGFGENQSLCHGDLGNLELFAMAAATLPGTDLAEETGQLLGGIVAGLEENGYICGLPHGVQSPGLLTGLAGIGYGLLRFADPAGTPSVLTLQAPP